jgi:galactose mutarotase-like enzyme
MKLSNEILAIEVAEHGAELVSLKKGEREYMWNGDEQFWNRHAPILFPAVGKPYNNELHIDGKVITMKQHGYARDSEFTDLGEGRMRMNDSKLSEGYPYKLVLEACYRLKGNTVEVAWTVENKDSRDAYFQMGAHPGFMLPDYDAGREVNGYICYYDKEGRAVEPVVVSDLDDGNRVPKSQKVVLPKEMPILADTFSRDALIIEQGQVATTELQDAQHNPVLRVSCEQADAYGIWSPRKKGCPFVCLEPWCGLCDPKGFTADISERQYIKRLAPGEKYTFTYIIEVM